MEQTQHTEIKDTIMCPHGNAACAGMQ